jgi:hypothetical protein
MSQRTYRIEDEGDEFHVVLIENGQQIGGALFPDNGTGDAFALANELGLAWEASK